MKNTLKLFAAATALALSATFSIGGAAAATFTFEDTVSGNVCTGGFQNCTYDGSGVIAKFNIGGNTELGLFDTIDGTEFTVEFADDGTGTGGTLDYKGTWTYTPNDEGDPEVVTAFAIKGANNSAIYVWDPLSGTDFIDIPWDMTANLEQNALSNITWWDTDCDSVECFPPVVIVPEVTATGSLAALGSAFALMSLMMERRRRRYSV